VQDTSLREVFKDIIEGTAVRRSKHELRWEHRDVTTEFIQALREHGYMPTLVERIALTPGERVPAFHVNDGFAYFGWVFWEKFSHVKFRKLFGSVVRNAKGDWDIQISERTKTVIYANMNLRTEMDIDNVSGF
jgi:hypothetical protein